MEFITNNLQETQSLAKRIASLSEEGDVIALQGTLGAGKTTFTQGFCSFFGITSVTSPTFTLINTYQGTTIVNHIDFYRLDDIEESYDIGIEEYLPPRNGITLVEWANKFPAVLPEEYISITITYAGEDQRKLAVNGIGNKHAFFEEKLASIK